MEKQIGLQVEITRDKSINIRMSLMIVDAGKVQFEHYHRFAMQPGANLAETRKMIEDHLAMSDAGIPFAPWGPIPESEWQEVVQHSLITFTPERVVAHANKVAAARAVLASKQ